MRHFCLVLFALTIFSNANAHEAVVSLDRTIKSILVTENPTISYQSQEFKDQYQVVHDQLTAIIDYLITPEAHDRVKNGSRMAFAEDRLIVKFTQAQNLDIRHDATTGLTTNDTELNRLIAKYGITGIEPLYTGSTFYLLDYTVEENPKLVAQELKKLDAVASADLDHVIGQSELNIRRLTPILYIIEVNWGDCFAGCIHQNRTYIEVDFNGVVNLIGRGGEDLDDSVDPLFLPFSKP